MTKVHLFVACIACEIVHFGELNRLMDLWEFFSLWAMNTSILLYTLTVIASGGY